MYLTYAGTSSGAKHHCQAVSLSKSQVLDTSSTGSSPHPPRTSLRVHPAFHCHRNRPYLSDRDDEPTRITLTTAIRQDVLASAKYALAYFPGTNLALATKIE